MSRESLRKHNRKLPSIWKIRPFVDELTNWYKFSGRNFWWRQSSLTIYQVIVTESLLQRTRAEVVNEFLPKFIAKYPNWRTLAGEEILELEKFLKPLGLQKRRARSLSYLANQVVDLGERVPKPPEKLAALAGVGQYVFNAVNLYRDNQPLPLLDASMARLIERYFGHRNLADIRYDPYLQQLSRKIVCSAPNREYKRLNWAMLDFAALVCKIRSPCCMDCPLAKNCLEIQRENTV